MSYNKTCKLWIEGDKVYPYAGLLKHQEQVGPDCVATSLAVIAGVSPSDFQDEINTQDPRTWSDALKRYGMRLAYCPADVRRLKYYIRELINYNGIFLLSYYTGSLLSEPDEHGWVCPSHIVVLGGDTIFDSLSSKPEHAIGHVCNEYHTKRIFRVVRDSDPRGL